MKLFNLAHLWLNLAYGEFLQYGKIGIKIGITIFLHFFLFLAIFFPGTLWGVYGASVSIVAWWFNVVLDRSGNNKLQQKIVGIEKKAHMILPTHMWEHITRFLRIYFRLVLFIGIVVLLGTITYFMLEL